MAEQRQETNGDISRKALYHKGIGLEIFWWLRSPGNNDNNAAVVDGDGFVNNNGNNINNEFGVRPASPYRQMFAPSGVNPCKLQKQLACIRQRNPIPFRAEAPREAGAEKHIPSVKQTRTGQAAGRTRLNAFDLFERAARYGL